MTLSDHWIGAVRLSVIERGQGAPVVFQHGLCGDAKQPSTVFPFEAFQAIMPEARGHGGSDAGPLDNLSIATFADDLASIIEARGLAPAIVGGISMGAASALRLAVTRPNLVRALILARPAWVTEAAPVNLRTHGFAGDLLARHDAKTALAIFDASDAAAALGHAAPANLASVRQLVLRSPQAVTAALLSRIAADGPGVTPDQVAALAVPTLVIGHGRDSVHPFAHAEALANLIGGARLVEITPKAADRHRHRAEFREALRDFLQDSMPD